MHFVEPLRERRGQFEKDLGFVTDILRDGAKKARERAEEKMTEVRSKIGVTKNYE